MKKLLAFIVLVSHINFSMFLPSLDEQDSYDANGKQVDDINSLFEYIDQVVLGNVDNTPEDEDDDQPHYFQVIKFTLYSFGQHEVQAEPVAEKNNRKNYFPLLKQIEFPSPVFDIPYPPPKA